MPNHASFLTSRLNEAIEEEGHGESDETEEEAA